MENVFVSHEFKCPFCKKNFSTLNIRPNSLEIDETETDLNIIYASDTEPNYYYVTVCPHCFYAHPFHEFEKISQASLKMLKREYWPDPNKLGKTTFNKKRNWDQAVQSFLILHEIYKIEEPENSKLANLYLRIGWLLRKIFDENESNFLKCALYYYKKSLVENEILTPEEKFMNTYYIAELAMRVGRYQEARDNFNLILQNKLKQKYTNILEFTKERLEEAADEEDDENNEDEKDVGLNDIGVKSMAIDLKFQTHLKNSLNTLNSMITLPEGDLDDEDEYIVASDDDIEIEKEKEDNRSINKLLIVYQNGEIIFKEGSIGEECYVIKKGGVDITKYNNRGQKIVLCTLQPGALFGEMALIKKGKRNATGIANGETELFEIKKDNFDYILQNQAEFGLKIIRTLIGRLAGLCRKVTEIPQTQGRNVSLVHLSKDAKPVEQKALKSNKPGSLILQPGQILFYENTVGEECYIIQEGTIEIFKITKTRSIVVIAHLRAGEIFGEMALLGASTRTASARAISPTSLLRVNKANLNNLLKKQAGFALKLIKIFSERLSKMDEQLKALHRI